MRGRAEAASAKKKSQGIPSAAPGRPSAAEDDSARKKSKKAEKKKGERRGRDQTKEYHGLFIGARTQK